MPPLSTHAYHYLFLYQLDNSESCMSSLPLPEYSKKERVVLSGPIRFAVLVLSERLGKL